jgi:hypothetical protein
MAIRIPCGSHHFAPSRFARREKILYLPLAITAGIGILGIWHRRLWFAAALLLWLAISSASARPDYLRILVDAGLDWGRTWIASSRNFDAAA